MKTANKLALLLAIPFIASCGSQGETGSAEPSVVYSSVWGEQYGEVIVKNLGVDLPYIENQGFDIELSTDNYGDPLVCIYVYEYEGKESTEMMEDYAVICADAGYQVTSGTQYTYDENYVTTMYTVYYADGWINDVDAVEIQFCEGAHDGKYALGIFAFNYVHYDTAAWPSNVVKKVLGHDVPNYYMDGCTYTAEMETDTDGSVYVYIAIDGTSEDSEIEYAEILEAAGYYVDDSEYDEYGYFAYPGEESEYLDHGLQFKFSYGYGLEIYVVPLDLSK